MFNRSTHTTGDSMTRSSLIFYQGSSCIDGSEIMGVLSGLNGTSANSKTGNVVQTWILSANEDPIRAAATGADYSICGNCIMRHYSKGACYVVLMHGPQNIYKSAKAGRIPKIQDLNRKQLHKVNRQLKKRPIRLGSYGDPAAIPEDVWSRILALVPSHTGFTHQWESSHAAWLKGLVMASCETRSAAGKAQAAGWKTSRTSVSGKPDRNEMICLNHAKDPWQCDECKICDGITKNVVGPVHGSRKGRFRNE